MGVTELIPFLLHRFPHVVRALPDRLQQLRGKTVVIDATLITLRFHFSPTPHPSRHVLGWHRLISELRQYDVHPICVFDGTLRSVAKRAEAERRKASLKLLQSRATVEEGRLQRLRRLEELMQALRKARSPRRKEVAAALAEPVTAAPSLEALFGDIDSTLASPSSQNLETEHNDPELQQLLSEAPDVPTEETVRRLSDLDSWSYLVNPRLDPTRTDATQLRDPSPPLPSPDVPPPDIALRDLPRLFKELISEYHTSIQNLHSVTKPPTSRTSDGTDTSISKRQIGLVAQEHQMWSELSSSLASSRPLGPIQANLAAMKEQSIVIAKSFERRLDVPTAQTHAESKDMLRVMGVPFLETDGPFEAEGLASSIVRNGYADYVVSEDTDVLAYQAPLLRNVTSRTGPLSLIDGAEVRQELGLTDSGYIDFALLLGTDFTERIPLVGPARALRFMKKYGSIEGILSHETTFPPRGNVEDFLERVRLGRNVFNTLPPVPPLFELRGREPNAAEVASVLASYNLHTEIWESHAENPTALGENFFNDSPVDGTFLPSLTYRS